LDIANIGVLYRAAQALAALCLAEAILMARPYIPPDAYSSDPVERFIRWKDAAIEGCVEACGLIPDQVDDSMWLHYYRTNLRAWDAGALIARLIS